jgi:hypothetical protein
MVMRDGLGMEATGYSRWFERLLAELGFERWIGHPAQIKAKRVKKQKYDREDARLLLRLSFTTSATATPEPATFFHVFGVFAAMIIFDVPEIVISMRTYFFRGTLIKPSPIDLRLRSGYF